MYLEKSYVITKNKVASLLSHPQKRFKACRKGRTPWVDNSFYPLFSHHEIIPVRAWNKWPIIPNKTPWAFMPSKPNNIHIIIPLVLQGVIFWDFGILCVSSMNRSTGLYHGGRNTALMTMNYIALGDNKFDWSTECQV